MIRASSLNSSRSSFFFTNFSEKVTGNVIQFCVIGKKEREREKTFHNLERSEKKLFFVEHVSARTGRATGSRTK